MKILLITSKGPDGLPDVLYIGLKQAGVSVVEYPYKPLYHCSKSDDGKILVCDKGGNKIGEEKEDGMIHFPKMQYGHYRIPKWFAVVEERGPDNSEGRLNTDNYDAIIVGTPGVDSYHIGISVLRKAAGRAYFLDGGDDPYIRNTYPWSKVYFKRELVLRDKWETFTKWAPRIPRYLPWWARRLDATGTLKNILIPNTSIDRVASLNLTIPPHEYDNSSREREYDISLVAGMTNPVRAKFAEQLVRFSREHGTRAYVNVSPGFYGSVPWNEYTNIIRRSKISVALPGLGYESMRYWEIPFYRTLLATPRLPIQINHNFVDMESAILFDSFDEFARKALEVLKTGSWVDLQEKCKDHFDTYHTSLRRAERVLSFIRQ